MWYCCFNIEPDQDVVDTYLVKNSNMIDTTVLKNKPELHYYLLHMLLCYRNEYTLVRNRDDTSTYGLVIPIVIVYHKISNHTYSSTMVDYNNKQLDVYFHAINEKQ